MERISCGTGRSDLAPRLPCSPWLSSRMMSLHSSMHSSQMNTDGPAISLRTSCWLLPQKEQYSSFSEPGLSDIAWLTRGGSGSSVLADGGGADSRLSPRHAATSARLTSTLSTRPYFVASSAPKKLSRSVSRSMVLMSCPVWRARISFSRWRRYRISLAWISMSVAWPWKPAHRLMDHHARVGQGKALALRPGRQQQRAHARRLPDAQRADVGLDELHRIVDRQAGGHRTARRVDVEGDVLFRVLRLQKQQLRDDQVGRHLVHDAHQKHHPLLQQTRVDVVGALAATALLDHHRNQPQAAGFVFQVLESSALPIHLELPISSSKSVGLSSALNPRQRPLRPRCPPTPETPLHAAGRRTDSTSAPPPPASRSSAHNPE